MKYMGSKNRIAKYLIPIITKDLKEDQYYIEPFVGGCNMIDKIDHPLRIGADFNEYLIAMWKELQNGWIPPEFIERDFYSKCRDKYNQGVYKNEEKHIIGYVGFNGSYGGRFFDGGYAGKSMTKSNKERNYPLESYNNITKQLHKIRDIKFLYSSYNTLNIPSNSIIYCDIPYKNSKEYKSSKGFNHEDFYNWAREMVKQGHKVFISEYYMPDDFVCIWEKEVSSSLSANGKQGGNKKSTEKLFIHKSQYKEPNEINLNEF